MASDIVLMENMVSAPPEKELLFKDSQPKVLNDSNNRVYNGTITFDTASLVQEYITWRETDLVVPFTVSVNGVLTDANCLGKVTGSTATTAGPTAGVINGIAPDAGIARNIGGKIDTKSINLSLKQSVLDIVQGLTIATGDGTQIVSEQYGPGRINNIRILVQNNLEWLDTFEEEMAMAKDTTPSIDVTNDGYMNRGAFLLQLCNLTYYNQNDTVGAGVNKTGYISKIEGLLTIPLRYVHSFFDACDYPMKGIVWKLTFQLCREFNPVSKYYGFNVPAASLNNFKFELGKGGTVNGQTYNACFLKYRAITLPDAFQQTISANADKLNRRVVKFVTTDVYDSRTNETAGLSSHQVSTGTVRPIRLWYYGVQNNAAIRQDIPNTTNMYLTSLNVRINNTNKYQNQLNHLQLWDELKQQFENLAFTNDKGSLIDFTDFAVTAANQPLSAGDAKQKGMYALYCIELARLNGRTDDQAVNILLDSMRLNSDASDYFILVEREMVAQFIFNQNACQVIIGSSIS